MKQKTRFQHGAIVYFTDEYRFHREDGPAVIAVNGNNAWWYKDNWIGNLEGGFTQEKFEQWLKLKIFQ